MHSRLRVATIHKTSHDCFLGFACASLRLLLFRVAFDALKHRDVAEVDWMPEGLVCFVAGFALAIGEAAEIDRMLEINGSGNC